MARNHEGNGSLPVPKRKGGNRACGQRIQRNARKLDREKVQALAAQGLSTTDIAKHQGTARTTVWRFLQQLKPQQHQLEQFKSNRADCLAQLHGKAVHVQDLALDRMLRDLEDDGFTDALTPTAKAKFLQAAVVAGGVSYDKERLERGQSTSNTSLMALIASADDVLYPKNCKQKHTSTEKP